MNMPLNVNCGCCLTESIVLFYCLCGGAEHIHNRRRHRYHERVVLPAVVLVQALWRGALNRTATAEHRLRWLSALRLQVCVYYYLLFMIFMIT
jgi:hypothetical protein